MATADKHLNVLFLEPLILLIESRPKVENEDTKYEFTFIEILILNYLKCDEAQWKENFK